MGPTDHLVIFALIDVLQRHGIDLDDAIAMAKLAGRIKIDMSEDRVLHDGEDVWIMGADDRLVVRRVKTVWKGRDVVVVRNDLKKGERLVVSNISTPIPGMRLHLEATIADGKAE